MKTNPLMLAAAALLVLHSPAYADEAAFDVLGSVMDTTKKEINAKQTVEATKKDFVESKFNKLHKAGYWQYFQGSSSAKKGEYCTAMFMREGMGVSIMGPGGSYKGALMMFFNGNNNPAFPTVPKPNKVLVTLTQGGDAPATVNAFNYTLGALELPVVVFAVPTIEAALAGMDDTLRFVLAYKGQNIADFEWHSAHAARDELKKCLAGQAFNTKNPLKLP